MNSDLSLPSLIALSVVIVSMTLVIEISAIRKTASIIRGKYDRGNIPNWQVLILALAFDLPLVVAAWIALLKSHSHWEMFWVILLTPLTAFTTGILNILMCIVWSSIMSKLPWVTSLSSWESLGMFFAWIPSLICSGWIAGAFLVTFSFGGIEHYYANPALTHTIAMLGTAFLCGLMPSIIQSIPQLSINKDMAAVAITVIPNALISAFLGSRLPHWLWQLNALARSLPSGG